MYCIVYLKFLIAMSVIYPLMVEANKEEIADLLSKVEGVEGWESLLCI